MQYLELDYTRNPFLANTQDVVSEYFEESDHAGGFVKNLHPQDLYRDVLLFAQHCEVTVDPDLVYMLVHRAN